MRITRIAMLNFKGVRERVIDDVDEHLNVLIGDNDSGKSSILLAIELALSSNAKNFSKSVKCF